MANIKPEFKNEWIYHVYNRGVEKRNIFLNERDYVRFMYNMFVCNGQERVFHLERLSNEEIIQFINNASANEEKQLVEILNFALMPNHFHISLKQKVDGGIVSFMQKLGISSTMCFNKKYERVGPLFQGNFKASSVGLDDAHFLYIPHYIHLNPLDLMRGDRQYIQTADKMHFLENYRWSSLPDYLGKNNFSNILNKDFLLTKFGGSAKYKKELLKALKEKEGINQTLFDEFDEN